MLLARQLDLHDVSKIICQFLLLTHYKSKTTQKVGEVVHISQVKPAHEYAIVRFVFGTNASANRF